MSPWKYFRVVHPYAAPVPFVFSAVGAYGVYVLWLSPSETETALALIAFVQMFAAATGFRPYAAAGHYDALLCGGRQRWRVGLAHFGWSSAPGAAAWTLVAAGELAVGKGTGAAALQPKALVALFVVSAVTWTLSAPAGRLAGGTLWTAALVVLAGTEAGRAFVRRALQVPAGVEPSGMLELTSVFVVVPFLLLGPVHPGGVVLGAVCLLALLVLLAGLWYVMAAEWPLGPAE